MSMEYKRRGIDREVSLDDAMGKAKERAGEKTPAMRRNRAATSPTGSIGQDSYDDRRRS